MSNESPNPGIRDRIASWAAGKLTAKATEFLSSDKGQEVVDKVLSSKLAEETGRKVLAAAQERILGEKGLSLLLGGGEISKTLISLLNANEATENSVFALLSQADQGDGALAAFLNSVQGKQALAYAQSMGEGATNQVLDGLGNQAYREWLAQNPPEIHPDVRGISKTILRRDDEHGDIRKCPNCTNERTENPCEHCLSTEETEGYSNVTNPDWTAQLQKFNEWQDKSYKKKKELGITSDSKMSAENVGAAIALAVAGLGTASLSSLQGLFGGSSAEAHAMVAKSLSGQTPSKHTAEDESGFRYGETLSPKEALAELKQAAQPKLDVDSYSTHKGSILAKNISLGNNGTIKGTVVSLEKFWAKAMRNAKIEGDLIILGKLTGFKLPEVTGKIYLVIDPEAGIDGKVDTRNVNVVTCTVDKAHQIAKKAGLLP